jgi:hypothetical protein
MKKIFFLASFKSMKKGVGSDPEPDPLVRGTNPGIRIRIRTKMSRIPNTAFNQRSETAESNAIKFPVS